MLKRTLLGTVACAVFAFAGTSQAQEKAHITIINDSSHTLSSIVVSKPGADNWEHQVLSSQVGPGGQVTIAIDTRACSWDIMASYDDEDTEEDSNVDLCALDGTVYTLTDSDSEATDEEMAAGEEGDPEDLTADSEDLEDDDDDADDADDADDDDDDDDADDADDADDDDDADDADDDDDTDDADDDDDDDDADDADDDADDDDDDDDSDDGADDEEDDEADDEEEGDDDEG